MRRFTILAGLGMAVAMSASVVHAQEIETFDSPDTLQAGGGNFKFSQVYTNWSVKADTTLTYNSTNFEVTSTGGYGSAYKSITNLDTNPSVNISGDEYLQLDMTINSGDAGPIVDLDDGEGDEYQYHFGYGLVGGAANNGPPQEAGEIISQGATPNEIVLDVPLTDFTDVNQTGTFDFTQVTGFNLEDDPGTNPDYDVQFNDLSGVNVPEPASLSLLAMGGLLIARRRR